MVDETLQERLRIRIPSDYTERYGVYMAMEDMKRDEEGKWVKYPSKEHENILLPWRYSDVEHPKEKAERLKEKFKATYPSHFPEELKEKGGTYWPLFGEYAKAGEKLKDEQILARILGFPLSLATRIGLAWKVRDELGKGKKILDLGFGYGDMSLILGEEIPGCEIVAVEKDETKVKMLQEVLRHYQFGNGQKTENRIEVVKGDVFDSETFSNYGPFDLVFIKDMLGFLTECEDLRKYPGENMKIQWRNALDEVSRRVLIEARRVLRPGGKVIIFDRDIGERGNPSMSLYRLAEILELEDVSKPFLKILEIGKVKTESDISEAKVRKEVVLSESEEGRAALLVCRKRA